MSEATARPWHISHRQIGETVYCQEIIDADGKRVLITEVETKPEADAIAFIVKAVNAHDKLVEALEEIAATRKEPDEYWEFEDWTSALEKCNNRARAALKEAQP